MWIWWKSRRITPFIPYLIAFGLVLLARDAGAHVDRLRHSHRSRHGGLQPTHSADTIADAHRFAEVTTGTQTDAKTTFQPPPKANPQLITAQSFPMNGYIQSPFGQNGAMVVHPPPLAASASGGPKKEDSRMEDSNEYDDDDDDDDDDYDDQSVYGRAQMSSYTNMGAAAGGPALWNPQLQNQYVMRMYEQQVKAAQYYQQQYAKDHAKVVEWEKHHHGDEHGDDDDDDDDDESSGSGGSTGSNKKGRRRRGSGGSAGRARSSRSQQDDRSDASDSRPPRKAPAPAPAPMQHDISSPTDPRDEHTSQWPGVTDNVQPDSSASSDTSPGAQIDEHNRNHHTVTPITRVTHGERDIDNDNVNPVLKCIFVNCSSAYLKCISNAGCSDVFQCLQSDTQMERCVKFHDSLSHQSQDIFGELGRCEEANSCFAMGKPHPQEQHHHPWAQPWDASSSGDSSGSSSSSSGSSGGSGGSGSDSSHSSASSDTSGGSSVGSKGSSKSGSNSDHSGGSSSLGSSSSSSIGSSTSSGSGSSSGSNNSSSGTSGSSKSTGSSSSDSSAEASGTASASGSVSSSINTNTSKSAHNPTNGTKVLPFQKVSCDTLCAKQCDLTEQMGGPTNPVSCQRACAIACFKARYVISL